MLIVSSVYKLHNVKKYSSECIVIYQHLHNVISVTMKAISLAAELFSITFD